MAVTLRAGSPEEVGMSGSRIRHVASLARQWVDEKAMQTLVLLVARRGVIVLHEAFGKLNPDVDAPVARTDALFPLASITKILTATALMTLVEEGRVGLNRPVFSYIPEFRGEGKEAVLVRHLLTHTSGLREQELEKYAKEHEGKVEIPPADETVHPLFHEYLQLRYGCPLWKPPGSEMSYADYNFNLVADIVRRVSRTSLDRLAYDRIFRPLGMKDTFYCRFDAPRERVVRGPTPPADPTNPVLVAMQTERYWEGSGGARSTAFDMAILGQMFLNGGAYGDARILSPASVAAMTRNQIPGTSSIFLEELFPEASWGLGWSIHGSKTGICGGIYSPAAYEHWGYGGVYFWVDPSTDVIGVFFSSVETSNDPKAWLKHWRSDLFTDAVSSAVVES